MTMVTVDRSDHDRGRSPAVGSQAVIVNSVLYRLVLLAKLHRSEFARELARLDLYIGQEQLLIQLWNQDGLSQAELAERLRVEPPTVTKMLQRMERMGFVRRDRVQERPRTILVYLTERGRHLREPVELLWDRSEKRLTEGLTHTESSALMSLLARLSAPDAPLGQAGRSLLDGGLAS